MTRTLSIWAILALTVLAVLLGLYQSGGPLEARKAKRDSVRESDLRSLTTLVECQAREGGKRLPEALETTSNCDVRLRLEDPFTDEPYVYTRQGDGLYRLCAKFETKADHWDGTVPFGMRDPETGCLTYEYTPD